MKRAIALGVALVAALAVTFAAQRPGSDSPVPLTTNQGPRGLAVLAAWLAERGADVRTLDEPLDALPADARTLVLAAPALAELDEAEVGLLDRFVQGGGTLVYLAPRGAPQPALNRWLGVLGGPTAPLNELPGVTDVGGSTVQVSRAAGALTGVTTLRISAERTVVLNAPDALEVAEHGALWWRKLGAGQVWVGAGADLAENARLELADNARFWRQLPTPIVFDELHHRARVSALPVNVTVTVLQLLFLAALFVWANAVRLGPPRDPLAPPGASTMDYVRAMASLTRNANVEAELVARLKLDFGKLLQERRLKLTDDELRDLENEHELLALSRRIARATAGGR